MLIDNPLSLVKSVIGMPFGHVLKIVSIALKSKCAIILRAPGPACTMLLEEGYDTKSYRIHSKSCNWGPMAGFVMLDPRLNKKGLKGAGMNHWNTDMALTDRAGPFGTQQGWKAGKTHLKISNARKAYLAGPKALGVTFLPANNHPDIAFGKVSFHGITFDFALHKEGGNVWGVYCRFKTAREPQRGASMPPRLGRAMSREAATQTRAASPPGRARPPADVNGIFRQERFGVPEMNFKSPENVPWLKDYEKMLALTNPLAHRHHHSTDHHLNALTGDYDLFDIWVPREQFDTSPKGLDAAPISSIGGPDAHTKARTFFSTEHYALARPQNNPGNLTPSHVASRMGDPTNRIYHVGQLVNSLIGNTKTRSDIRLPHLAHPKRTVIFHSVETRNPNTGGIDLPLIACMPTGVFYVVESMQDFRDLIDKSVNAGLNPTLAGNSVRTPNGAAGNFLNPDLYGRYVHEQPTDSVGPGDRPNL